MLTDPFADDWLDALHQRFRKRPDAHALHVLVDGAFVPGLHRRIAAGRKALLFEGLPASGPGTLDVSPFILPFDPGDRALLTVLDRCRGWSMVSVIETPEPWRDLAARLAAWCIIEADGQRFNFRFADTRRLPAILNTLAPAQRGQLTGPAVSWSHIGRDGSWRTIALDASGEAIATEPQLDDARFAALVEDSRADEVLARLADHPELGTYRPSQAHALISSALAPALKAGMGDVELVDWCGWLLGHCRRNELADIARSFTAWKADALSMEAAHATEI
ncbi:DUF4123 domain-containing protein [Massilia sp. BSC265]|uniref:DUF4123 domain-containing protein n=1 Tax=Massilia sp. BSC265 TaxID=1549812 RepID=UPI0004E91447|nr:DUF4123 domain-containing protein [Massilia sp. BSC265]KFI06709.1 hypothetical protein JN27_13590 [Massilia sp. BSC265]